MLLRETCKNNISWLDLRANAGELPELRGAEISLNGVLERLNQIRNFGDDRWAGHFISQCTQYTVLVVCARKATLDTDARQHEGAFPIQVKRARAKDETAVHIFGSPAIHRIRQCDVDTIHSVDKFYEGAHICSCVVIYLYSKVKRKGTRQQARPLRGVIGVSKTGVSVQIGLIKFFVILPVNIICNIRDLNPQVTREFQNGHFGIHKIDAHDTNHICQAVKVTV